MLARILITWTVAAALLVLPTLTASQAKAESGCHCSTNGGPTLGQNDPPRQ